MCAEVLKRRGKRNENGSGKRIGKWILKRRKQGDVEIFTNEKHCRGNSLNPITSFIKLASRVDLTLMG